MKRIVEYIFNLVPVNLIHIVYDDIDSFGESTLRMLEVDCINQ